MASAGASALITSVQKVSLGWPHSKQGGAAAVYVDNECCCVVCMDAARCVVLASCGHVVLCEACSEAGQAKRNEVRSTA